MSYHKVNILSLHNQIIVYPVTGMNNYTYDTKGHGDNERKIIEDQNEHSLSDNTDISALNRTDQSTLSDIDYTICY